jgi:Arc/MetJ-type ribon-helix-helix transcriptional regulator
LFDTSIEVFPELSVHIPRELMAEFKYVRIALPCLTVFDNAPAGRKARSREPEADQHESEDARIALRCTLKELRLVDSFVGTGEFATRSELMRAALHAFLRSRAMSTAPTPPVDAEGYLEIPVRLRLEEFADIETYAKHVLNGVELRDVLAMIFRNGEAKMELREMAQRTRARVREAASARTHEGALSESGRDLERKGVVGR